MSPSTYTAQEVLAQTFTAYELAALQRFEAALLAAGQPLGPKMSAAKTWLETIMVGAALDPSPQPSDHYGNPGVTFAETVAEAVASLTPVTP